MSNIIIKYTILTFFLFAFFLPETLIGQPFNINIATNEPTVDQTFSAMKALEANFPIPQPETNITIAILDLSGLAGFNQNHTWRPKLNFLISAKTNDYNLEFGPDVGGDKKAPPVQTKKHIYNILGSLALVNVRHLNIKIAIHNWEGTSTSSVKFQYGKQMISVPYGTSEVTVSNVDTGVLSLTISVHIPGGKPADVFVRGPINLEIERNLIAAGAMEIPVLPVYIYGEGGAMVGRKI